MDYRWWLLAGYTVGLFISARIAYLWAVQDEAHDDAKFIGVLVGVLWPCLVVVGAALTPFMALGWLVSRPVGWRPWR